MEFKYCMHFWVHEYIKLKESEKTARSKVLEAFPSLLHEIGRKALTCDRCSQCPEGKELLSLRTKVEKKVKTHALLGLPQLTTLTALPFYYIPHERALFT